MRMVTCHLWLLSSHGPVCFSDMSTALAMSGYPLSVSRYAFGTQETDFMGEFSLLYFEVMPKVSWENLNQEALGMQFLALMEL